MVSRKGGHWKDNWICTAPKGTALPPDQPAVTNCRRQQLHECSKYLLRRDRLLIFKTSSGLNSCAKLHLYNARSLRLPGPSFHLIHTPLCSSYTLKCGTSSIIPSPPEPFYQTSCNLNLFCGSSFYLLNLGRPQMMLPCQCAFHMKALKYSQRWAWSRFPHFSLHFQNLYPVSSYERFSFSEVHGMKYHFLAYVILHIQTSCSFLFGHYNLWNVAPDSTAPCTLLLLCLCTASKCIQTITPEMSRTSPWIFLSLETKLFLHVTLVSIPTVIP